MCRYFQALAIPPVACEAKAGAEKEGLSGGVWVRRKAGLDTLNFQFSVSAYYVKVVRRDGPNVPERRFGPVAADCRTLRQRSNPNSAFRPSLIYFANLLRRARLMKVNASARNISPPTQTESTKADAAKAEHSAFLET